MTDNSFQPIQCTELDCQNKSLVTNEFNCVQLRFLIQYKDSDLHIIQTILTFPYTGMHIANFVKIRKHVVNKKMLCQN